MNFISARRPGSIPAFLVALVLLGCSAGTAQDAPSGEEFVGVWKSTVNFPPELRGQISVTRSGSTWLARAGAQSVTLKPANGDMVATFAGGSKLRFQAPLASSRSPLKGIWIQAIGISYSYPHAAPIALNAEPNATADSRWTGTIPVVEDALTFFLVVQPGEGDGPPRAFLRNPDRNLGVFLRVETLEIEGNEVRGLNRDRQTQLAGTYHRDSDMLSLFVDRASSTFDFRRLPADDLEDFVPAPPGHAYTYRPPADLNDGWKVARGSSSLDTKKLEEMVRFTRETKTDNLFAPYLHSLQVAHRGVLVLDEYFHGHHARLPHDTRSAGKSLTAVLAGAARQSGIDVPLDNPIYSLFGFNVASLPERKQKMTLRHLLTMSPGWECDDDNYDSKGNEGRMQDQSEQPDWYRYALDLKMVAEPGENDVYCSAGMNLAGGVVAANSKRALPELFRDLIAEPLEIETFFMNLDPLERGYFGGGIRLRPRDLTKFGQLMLDDGVWNGKRILASEWVKEAVSVQSSLNVPDDYGLGWWRLTYEVDGQQLPAFYTSGNGGQMTIVIPSLELVVNFNAGNYNNFGTWRNFRDEYLPRFIIPAVKAGT